MLFNVSHVWSQDSYQDDLFKTSLSTGSAIKLTEFISSALSLVCHRELNACFRDSVCKELHNKYVASCEETIVEHATCTEYCWNAYKAFTKVSSFSYQRFLPF